jgi:hypothetical protein
LYYVAAPACTAERIGVGRSLSRSAYLTEGHRGQIFGALFLIAAVEFISAFILGFVIAMGVIVLSGHPMDTATASIVTQAVSVVLQAFNAVVAGVFYYQLRVAKEGVDIDKIASVFD